MQIIINGDSFSLCPVPVFNGNKKRGWKKVVRKSKNSPIYGRFKLSSAYHPASRLLRQRPIRCCGGRVVGAVFVGRRWSTYETMAHLGVPAAPILITPLPCYWLMETLSGLLGGGQTFFARQKRGTGDTNVQNEGRDIYNLTYCWQWTLRWIRHKTSYHTTHHFSSMAVWTYGHVYFSFLRTSVPNAKANVSINAM